MLFICSYFGVIQWQYQEYCWGVLFCSRSNGLRQDKEMSPLYGSKMLCHMPPIMHHNNIICVFVPAMWMSHPRLCILCYAVAVGSLDNTDDVCCVINYLFTCRSSTLHYVTLQCWSKLGTMSDIYIAECPFNTPVCTVKDLHARIITGLISRQSASEQERYHFCST